MIHGRTSNRNAVELEAAVARLHPGKRVRATVNGRQAVVTASTSSPITTSGDKPYEITAEEAVVQPGVRDFSLNGVPEADEQVRQLIDAVQWESW